MASRVQGKELAASLYWHVKNLNIDFWAQKVHLMTVTGILGHLVLAWENLNINFWAQKVHLMTVTGHWEDRLSKVRGCTIIAKNESVWRL